MSNNDEVQSFDCKFDDFDGGRNTDASVSFVIIHVPIRNWKAYISTYFGYQLSYPFIKEAYLQSVASTASTNIWSDLSKYIHCTMQTRSLQLKSRSDFPTPSSNIAFLAVPFFPIMVNFQQF